jgi:hypothetical protein
MNWKKNIPLIVGGAVVVLLLIAAAVFLALYFRGYSEVRSELEAGSRSLQRLVDRDPYPSEDNIEAQRDNLDLLTLQLQNVVDSLKSRERPVETMEAAEFPHLLQKTINGLNEKARQIELPDRFAYGFTRYAEGALPVDHHIPRLVRQIRNIELICGILFETGIESLDGLRRQEFEQMARDEGEMMEERSRGRRREAPAAASPGRGDGLAAEEYRDDLGLLAAETLVLSFTAKESAVWEILKKLADIDAPVVVTDVDATNESIRRSFEGSAPREEVLIEANEAANREQVVRHPPREERLVAGRESVEVSMRIDVYRLLEQDRDGGNAE